MAIDRRRGFCDDRRVGAPRFLARTFRTAPNKRRFVKALVLGNKRGDRDVTSADGTTLSVRRTGDGTPVVVVHGALDGIGAFSVLEVELSDRYAVWVYDRRGRGGSGDSDDYSLDREIDDLRAVIAATGAPAHVFGHSYGALIALGAARGGVEMRSLVLYEPPINGDAVDAAQVDAIRRAVDDGRLDDAIRTMASDLAGLTPEEIELGMAVPPVRKRLRDGAGVVPREIDAVRHTEPTGPPISGTPTLVIRGERENPAYPSAEQASALAVDAEVVTIAGQGHVAHVLDPWTFTATVRQFLDRH